MKLGLKELKQLYNTILEIAKVSNISHQEEAASKFFDDMRKNMITNLD